MNPRIEASYRALIELADLPGPPQETHADPAAILAAASDMIERRHALISGLSNLSTDDRAVLHAIAEVVELIERFQTRTADWSRAIERARSLAGTRVAAARKLRSRNPRSRRISENTTLRNHARTLR